jgi:SAM-dependent methyltransferase
VTSASSYDTFAPFYDYVVGERGDVAQFLRALLKAHHPSARSLLEFGCGSGSMLRVLSKHYRCTGIDNSEAMLAIARSKSPRARLIHGDIERTNVGERFDAVLCPFDTINHIPTKRAWRRVFANAVRHMAPKGVFIFDINTPAKMLRYCNEPITAEVGRDRISLVEVKPRGRDHYTIIARLLTRRDESAAGRKPKQPRKSTKGATYELHTLELRELILHPKEVLRELSSFFHTVTIIDPDRRYPNEESEEIFFVCKDPFAS